jgi:hypothetical protein
MNNAANPFSANIKEFKKFEDFYDAFENNKQAYTGAFFTLFNYNNERVLYGYIKNITSRIISSSHYSVNVRYSLQYFNKADTSSGTFTIENNQYKVEVELNNKKNFSIFNYVKGGRKRKTKKNRKHLRRRKSRRN